MLRVGNLQRSIDFYTQVLGMKLLRTTERPEQKYDLAFLGYGSNPEHAEIELTHNYGVDRYELGSAFGHLAIGVPDIYGTCERLAKDGVKIPRPPGPMKHGGSVIAFIEDPNGDTNTSDRIKNVIWLSTDLHAIIFSPISVDGLFTHSVPELVSGSIGENTLFRELPPSILVLLSGVPAVITQVSEFDIDRYTAVLMTIDPTVVSPTAQFDFYDRTGAVVHSIGFTAVP